MYGQVDDSHAPSDVVKDELRLVKVELGLVNVELGLINIELGLIKNGAVLVGTIRLS